MRLSGSLTLRGPLFLSLDLLSPTPKFLPPPPSAGAIPAGQGLNRSIPAPIALPRTGPAEVSPDMASRSPGVQSCHREPQLALQFGCRRVLSSSQGRVLCVRPPMIKVTATYGPSLELEPPLGPAHVLAWHGPPVSWGAPSTHFMEAGAQEQHCVHRNFNHQALPASP